MKAAIANVRVNVGTYKFLGFFAPIPSLSIQYHVWMSEKFELKRLTNRQVLSDVTHITYR